MKMKFLYLLPIFIFTLNISFIYSEAIDFNKVLRMAIQNNSDIQKLERELKIRKLQRDQSFLNLFYPSVTLGGNASYQFYTNENIIKVRQGSEEVEITNYYNDNYSFYLKFSKTLFSGFKNYNDYRTKEFSLKLKEKELQDKKEEIKFNLLSSYFKITILSQNINLLKLQLEVASNQLEEAKEKFNLKRITLMDFNQTNLNYQQTELKLLTAINDYEKEKLNLFKIIGIEDINEFVIIDSIENMESYVKITSNLNPNDILAIAISNDINYLTYEYNLISEQLNKNTLEWSRLPSISAGVDYKYNYEKDPSKINIRSWQGNWSISLSFSIPIDSLFPDSSIDSQIKQSEENINIAKVEMESYKKSLLNTIKTYLLEVEYNKKSLEIQKSNLNLTQENLNLARKQLELGRITKNDFLKIELEYLQAKYELANAIYNYILSVAKIIRLTGGNL